MANLVYLIGEKVVEVRARSVFDLGKVFRKPLVDAVVVPFGCGRAPKLQEEVRCVSNHVSLDHQLGIGLALKKLGQVLGGLRVEDFWQTVIEAVPLVLRHGWWFCDMILTTTLTANSQGLYRHLPFQCRATTFP